MSDNECDDFFNDKEVNELCESKKESENEISNIDVIQKTWKFLNRTTSEDDVVGGWYAEIFSNKELNMEFNIHYTDHEKSIKPQYLTKSRFHLNKRGTSILSSKFIREILNIFPWQCILCSPSGEFDAFSAEFKSKGNEISTI